MYAKDSPRILIGLQRELSGALRKGMELQERIASLLEDKAKLQFSLKRAMMNIERRDMRIRELERENEELRKMEKRAADIHDRERWDTA